MSPLIFLDCSLGVRRLMPLWTNFVRFILRERIPGLIQLHVVEMLAHWLEMCTTFVQLACLKSSYSYQNGRGRVSTYYMLGMQGGSCVCNNYGWTFFWGRTKCHNKRVKMQIVAMQLFGIFQMSLHSEVSLSVGCVFPYLEHEVHPQSDEVLCMQLFSFQYVISAICIPLIQTAAQCLQWYFLQWKSNASFACF